MCELAHKLPQGNSVEQITKQHENRAKAMDAHALVSPLGFNCEYLLRQGFQGCQSIDINRNP